MPSHTLAEIGLIADIVGVLFLAYDVVLTPIRRRHNNWNRLHSDIIAEHNAIIARYKGREGEGVWTKEYVEHCVRETEEYRDRVLQSWQEGDADSKQRYEALTFRWGLFGLVLVLLGFILQFCALL
jgi:hypothetical protein